MNLSNFPTHYVQRDDTNTLTIKDINFPESDNGKNKLRIPPKEEAIITALIKHYHASGETTATGSGLYALADGCLHAGQQAFRDQRSDSSNGEIHPQNYGQYFFLDVTSGMPPHADYSLDTIPSENSYPIGPMRKGERTAIENLFKFFTALEDLTSNPNAPYHSISSHIRNALSGLFELGYQEESIVDAQTLEPNQIRHILNTRGSARKFAHDMRKAFTEQYQGQKNVPYTVQTDVYKKLHPAFPDTFIVDWDGSPIQPGHDAMTLPRLSVFHDREKRHIITFTPNTEKIDHFGPSEDQ